MNRGVCLWTIYPNQHQRVFFNALREAGVDLQVCYFGVHGADRVALGWRMPESLPPAEHYAPTLGQARGLVPGYDRRIQVTTGFYSRIYWRVALDASRRRKPWVLWSEASSRRLRSWPLRRLLGAWIRRRGAGVFAIGDMAKRDLQDWGIPGRMIRYLPYATPPRAPESAVDGRLAAFLRESPGGQTVFIYAGSLSLWKGTDLLLRAFCTVNRSFPGTRLLLVGPDASEGRLRQWLGCCRPDAVCLRGPMPPERIDDAFLAASVAVLPSRRKDGWGMAMAEAARNSLALIATDCCGCVGHIVRDNVSGRVVRAADEGQLAEAMMAYAGDPSLAIRHGQAACEQAQDTSPARCAERFMEGMLQFEGGMDAQR